MRKRIVSLLMALVMVFSLIPTTVFAAEDHDGQVRVIVENTTFLKANGAPWDGTLVDKWVALSDDSTMMSCVVDALGSYTQTGAESNYITEINGLEAGAGVETSGWMGTLNDWFTNEGFGGFTVKNRNLTAGDEIRIMYSLDYGEDIGGSWGNGDKTVKAVAFSAGTLSGEFSADVHAYTLTVPADVSSVVVTPTASNKNFQVRTSVDGVEYKRTASVPVANGTVITVKCGDPSWPTMNTDYKNDAAQTYTFTVKQDTAAQSITLNKESLLLAVGEEEKLSATVEPANSTETVAWSSSAPTVATVGDDGTVTAVAAGKATITAKAGSVSTTCEVTVLDMRSMTVNVAPKTADVTFYSDAEAKTELASDKVQDKGQVKVGSVTYHQYQILLPKDLPENTVYSYRGTESSIALGGEAFTPKAGETLHLLRTNICYNSTAALQGEGDYTITLKNGEADVVCGTPYVASNKRYTPALLIAGAEHVGTVTLADKWQDDYYATGSFKVTPSKTAGSASSTSLSVIKDYKKISVTAPKDAAVSFFQQEKNYVVKTITPDDTVTNEDGTVTYLFKSESAHKDYQYRATMTGKVTQAGYLKDGDKLTVTFPNRAVTDTTSTMARDDNSVLLNIDDTKDTNELSMQMGETFKLRAFRAAWEIVNTESTNQMIEPDFHYTVLSGQDVVSVEPTSQSQKGDDYCSGNASGNWMNVTALKEGVAVVAVYYDAIDVYGANPANATGITNFGAADPARYGYVVIHVGKDTTANVKPVSSDGDWDAEFDTVYYTGESGTFSFTSDDASAVTVRNLYGTTMGSEVTVSKDADGKWNVPVKNGSNLIAITTADGVDYRLVRAAKVTVTYTNVTTGKSDTDIAKLDITQGDTLKIHVDGLHMPVPKMSGIYNPGYMGTAKAAYVLNDTFTILSAGTQYDFVCSDKTDVTFKVVGSGQQTLSGYISLSSMGDDFGNHRNITDEGKPENKNASEKFGSFGILPEATFTAKPAESGGITYEEATSLKSASIIVGGSSAYFCAASFNTVKDNQNTKWANKNTNGMSVTVTTTSYYNSIKLRYWYEGETDVKEMPLTSGIGKVISDFQKDTTKMLNIEIVVTPADPELGAAKVYSYVVIPDGNATSVHPVISGLTVLDSAGTSLKMTPAISYTRSEYMVDVGAAQSITLNATMLQKNVSDKYNTADKADTVTVQRKLNGTNVGEATKVAPADENAYPLGKWTLENLDISGADMLEIQVVSYYDKTTRIYHIALDRSSVAPDPDQIAAEKVMSAISKIGEVTLSSKTAIADARSAYDALTDAQKKLVTNEQVLLDAEAAYAKLMAGLGKKLDNIYTSVGESLQAQANKSAPIVGSIGGEWLALGLARSGRTVPAGYYENVVEYVKANINANERLDETKSTENSRIILALTAIGKDVTSVGGHNLLKGLDSMEYIQLQGSSGPVWALIALDSHDYTPLGDVTREKLVEAILKRQLDNGAWSIISSKPIPDVDMTAMAVQALAPYYDTNDKVKTAVDKALDFLSSKQGKDGDYSSVETCAQVIVALTALGIDPAADGRFIKNGVTTLDALCSYYAQDDTLGNGFAHVKETDGQYIGGAYNQMATEQGYYALAAYFRMKAGKTFLYDMNDVCIGHKFGEWTVTKEATCTENGSRKHVCSVCGAEETQTIKALGHKFGDWTVTKKATCIENGSQKRVCSVCQAEEIQTIKALGHKFGNWTVIKEATRTEEGLRTRTCGTCGAIEKEVIPVRGSRPSTSKPTETVKSSQTGDNSQMTLWMGGVLLSAAALVVLNRKKKHSEE